MVERAWTDPIVDGRRRSRLHHLLELDGNRRREQRERGALHSIGACAIEARMRMVSRIVEGKLLELQRAETSSLRLGQLVRPFVRRVVVVAVMAAARLCLVEMLVPVRQRAHGNGEAGGESEQTGEETSRQRTGHDGKLTSSRNGGTGRPPRVAEPEAAGRPPGRGALWGGTRERVRSMRVASRSTLNGGASG